MLFNLVLLLLAVPLVLINAALFISAYPVICESYAQARLTVVSWIKYLKQKIESMRG